MRKLIFSILILLLIMPFSMTAQSSTSSPSKPVPASLFPGISGQMAEELAMEKRLDRYPDSADEFMLLPDTESGKYILKEISGSSFNTAVESLFFIPFIKKTGTSNQDGSLQAETAGKTALENSLSILTKIETLEGIKYYSVSHEKERVLFENAEIISDNRVIASYSPGSGMPEGNFSIQAMIRDTTFGENRYALDYSVTADSIVMKMSNLDTLTLGFLPVTGKGKLVFYLAVIPSGEGLFLYCCGLSKTINSDFIRQRIGQSVYNRITALFNWFSFNYAKTGINR